MGACVPARHSQPELVAFESCSFATFWKGQGSRESGCEAEAVPALGDLIAESSEGMGYLA